EKLLFLTDVKGIKNGEEIISEASPRELQRMIDSGVISGGMIPKVNALLAAVSQGVKSAHIIDGRVPHNLLAELFTEHGVGTWIHRQD
ncbi:MAG: arginine biosynthesis protein ArgJ, partial [Myxococcales bacterium]|nr:arginine biosynthesis protein ArgJ [Myxococcales bacterium]